MITLQRGNNRDVIFVNTLFDTLRSTTVDAYLRYLIGKKLAKKRTIKRIYSWSEGQLVDRMFYKGIKEHNSKIVLYGCQLFLQSKKQIYTVSTKVDKIFNLVPDITLVNGVYYMNTLAVGEQRLGVSLRSHIGETEKDTSDKNGIIVLLPYYRDEMITLLEILKDSKLASMDILIKLHPTHNPLEISSLIQDSWKVVDGNLLSLLKKISIVITIGSSTAVDAIALEKSVLLVTKNRSTMTNFLIKEGYKTVWDIAQLGKRLMKNLIHFKR